MKLRILACTAVLAVLWAAAGAVVASDQATGQMATGREPFTAATAGKPKMVVPELKYAFDPVVDGTEVTHGYTVKNTGDGPLAITQVKTG